MIYSEMRLSGLEKDDGLPRSVAIVKSDEPGFEPDLIDPDYFDWSGT